MPLEVLGRKPGYTSATKPQTAPMRGGRIQSLAESAVQRQLPQGAPRVPETPRVEAPAALPLAPEPVAELAREQAQLQPRAQQLPGGFVVQPQLQVPTLESLAGIQAAVQPPTGAQALTIPGALAAPTAAPQGLTQLPDASLMQSLGYLQDMQAAGMGAQKPGGGGEAMPGKYGDEGSQAVSGLEPAYDESGKQVGYYDESGQFYDLFGKPHDPSMMPGDVLQQGSVHPLSWDQEAAALYEGLGETEEEKASRHERMMADMAAGSVMQAEQMASRGGGGAAGLGYGDIWTEGTRQLAEQDFQISQAEDKNKMAMLETAMRAAESQGNRGLQEQVHQDLLAQREDFFNKQLDFKMDEAAKGENLEALAMAMGLTGQDKIPMSVFGQLMQEGTYDPDNPQAFYERYTELMTAYLKETKGESGNSLWDEMASGAEWLYDVATAPIGWVKDGAVAVYDFFAGLF